MLAIKNIIKLLLFSALLGSLTSMIFSGILEEIPDQVILPTDRFTPFNLFDAVEAGYICTSYTVTADLTNGVAGTANTTPVTNYYAGTMSAALKITYGGVDAFADAMDEITFFDEANRVVGKGTAINLSDTGPPNYVFACSVAGPEGESYPVRAEFYSAAAGKVFTVDAIFTYTADGVLGAMNAPMPIDLLPIEMLASTNGEISVKVTDDNWTGQQCYLFTVGNCTPTPSSTQNATRVCFKVLDGACPTSKTISTRIADTRTIYASQTIYASNTVAAGANVSYEAGVSVTLQPGFHAEVGTDFTASIGNCSVTPIRSDTEANSWQRQLPTSEVPSAVTLEIQPTLVQTTALIKFYLPAARSTSIHIIDATGQLMTITPTAASSSGWNQTTFSAGDLPNGIYFVQLQAADQVITKRLMIAR